MTNAYSQLKQVKSLLNIPDSVSAPDEKIGDRMIEADNYVNVQISIHAATPIANPDKELVTLTSSLAAATYNYWQTPAKDRTMEGIEKWEKRIQNHIMAVYGKKNPTGLSANSFSKSISAVTGTET